MPHNTIHNGTNREISRCTVESLNEMKVDVEEETQFESYYARKMKRKFTTQRDEPRYMVFSLSRCPLNLKYLVTSFAAYIYVL